MKICLLTHSLPRYKSDSAAPFIDQLGESLTTFRNKVFVLTPYDKKIDSKLKRNYKMITYRYIFPDNLHLLGYSRNLDKNQSLKKYTYFLAPFFLIFGFINLLVIVKKERIEVITAHWIIPNGFIAALVSIVTNVPFIVTVPGSDVYLAGKSNIFKQMAKFSAQKASFVISDSIHYLNQLKGLGIILEKTKVIRYGVDMKKIKPLSKSKKLLENYNLDTKTRIILAVGRFVPKKGFIYLINALPLVLQKFPDTKLVLIGDGELKKDFVARVQELNLESEVIFTGTVPHQDLVYYYNLCDVFIMPSIKDQYGNIDASPVAMMEAMATGAPVITTRFSADETLVIPNVTGLLIKEKSSNELSNAIIKLFKAKINKKLVRDIAVRNFSLRNTSLEYLKLFNESIS